MNAGTLVPPLAGRVLRARTPSAGPHLICRVVLVEHEGRYALIDTGFGEEDLRAPRERLGGSFLWMAGPKLQQDELVTHKLYDLGIETERIEAVYFTHLDLDHTGGLPAFGEAKAIAHEAEIHAAFQGQSRKETLRYRRDLHLAQHPRPWGSFPTFDETWFGLPAAPLQLLPEGDAFVLDLPGHSAGHCGFALREEGRWTVFVGDACLEIDEFTRPDASTPLGVRLHHLGADHNRQRARETRAALHRAFVRAPSGTRWWTSHDPREALSP